MGGLLRDPQYVPVCCPGQVCVWTTCADPHNKPLVLILAEVSELVSIMLDPMVRSLVVKR